MELVPIKTVHGEEKGWKILEGLPVHDVCRRASVRCDDEKEPLVPCDAHHHGYDRVVEVATVAEPSSCFSIVSLFPGFAVCPFALQLDDL